MRSHGVPVVIVPILMYTDDTSGNKSKKWNKFESWCLSLAGLPLQVARNLEHIHFVTCSNKLSALQMAGPMVKDLQKLEKGIQMFDAFTGSDVLVIAQVMCVLCDNVQAAQLLNHLGSRANKFCRKCMVHVYTNAKTTDKYNSLVSI